jgi:hypothetical protein
MALIPTSCEMPDLSGSCPPITPSFLLQAAFFGNNGLSDRAALSRRTIVRLTDKTVSEYGQARNAVLSQLQERNRPPEEMMRTGRVIYMFAFVDHMENCINACRRLLALFKHLANDPTISNRVAVQAALTHALSRDVSNFRNTIEHMEERISTGQIEDRPVVLALSDDSAAIEVGKNSIALASLATLIKCLHEAAQSLVGPASSSSN